MRPPSRFAQLSKVLREKPLVQRVSRDKSKAPIQMNGSFLFQLILHVQRRMVSCTPLLEYQKLLIVLVVTAESQKGLVVKAKQVVALISMNCAKRKLKIVTKRDFLAIFFANTRHIAS